MAHIFNSAGPLSLTRALLPTFRHPDRQGSRNFVALSEMKSEWRRQGYMVLIVSGYGGLKPPAGGSHLLLWEACWGDDLLGGKEEKELLTKTPRSAPNHLVRMRDLEGSITLPVGCLRSTQSKE